MIVPDRQLTDSMTVLSLLLLMDALSSGFTDFLTSLAVSAAAFLKSVISGSSCRTCQRNTDSYAQDFSHKYRQLTVRTGTLVMLACMPRGKQLSVVIRKLDRSGHSTWADFFFSCPSAYSIADAVCSLALSTAPLPASLGCSEVLLTS